MKELQPISPKTLADALKELKNSNLVKRESFNEIPPRVDYTLTEEGNELRHAIIPILQWAISKKGSVIAHCSCSLIEKGKRIDRINVIQYIIFLNSIHLFQNKCSIDT